MFLSDLGTIKAMSIAVVKYGGGSQRRVEDIAKHAEHVRSLLEWYNKIVVIVSGPGDITNRVESALEKVEEYGLGIITNSELNEATDPLSIFEPWAELYKACGKPEHLRKISDVVYKSFKKNLKEIPEVRTDGERIAREAEVYLYPEKLQAELVCHVYREAGLEALCINFDSPLFPLAVRGHYLNAEIDFDGTRKNSGGLQYNVPERVIISPGFGGKDGKVLKTLGRNGSDTSAFAMGHALKADFIGNYTTERGIKRAVFDGVETETVPEILIGEAIDGAHLGAKLPNRYSLTPLRKMHAENLHPEVRIAHHLDPNGESTKIVEISEQQDVVKFVSGKVVQVYEVEGDFYSVLNRLKEKNVDHTSQNASPYGGIILLGKGKNTSNRIRSEIGEKVVRNCGEEGMIKILESWQGDWVGAVGEGMRRKVGSDRLRGILKENLINVELGADPGFYSVGAVTANGNLEKSLRALHDEFFSR